jgi:D-alanyl-D-alanine carboxypeptidase
VRAKTGTTDIASALSGYVRRNVAFAILDNGDPVNWDAAHRSQDRFVQALARFG